MNILLWVLQVLLALAFAAHGWMMLFPSPEIAAQMNANLPRWFSLFIGRRRGRGSHRPDPARGHADHAVPGGLGRGRDHDHHGVGVGLPRRPRRGTAGTVTTFILLLMATFVAYGRSRLQPIRARAAAW